MISPGPDREAMRERVGSEIRRLRQRMGCTQADAALQALGSEAMQSHWSRWERGEVMPQVANLEAIARWAGVPMSNFELDDAPDTRPNAEQLTHAARLIEEALAILRGEG